MSFSTKLLRYSDLEPIYIPSLGLWSALESADIHFRIDLGVNFVDFQAGVSKPTLVQAQALLF